MRTLQEKRIDRAEHREVACRAKITSFIWNDRGCIVGRIIHGDCPYPVYKENYCEAHYLTWQIWKEQAHA